MNDKIKSWDDFMKDPSAELKKVKEEIPVIQLLSKDDHVRHIIRLTQQLEDIHNNKDISFRDFVVISIDMTVLRISANKSDYDVQMLNLMEGEVLKHVVVMISKFYQDKFSKDPVKVHAQGMLLSFAMHSQLHFLVDIVKGKQFEKVSTGFN